MSSLKVTGLRQKKYFVLYTLLYRIFYRCLQKCSLVGDTCKNRLSNTTFRNWVHHPTFFHFSFILPFQSLFLWGCGCGCKGLHNCLFLSHTPQLFSLHPVSLLLFLPVFSVFFHHLTFSPLSTPSSYSPPPPRLLSQQTLSF